MDDTTSPLTPSAPQTPPPAPAPIVTPPQHDLPPEPKRHYGPVIGIIIIVALLLLGGLYLWGMQILNQEEEAPQAQLNQSDPMLEQYEAQSSSDELDAIEADLQATSFDELDNGAAAVDAEL